MQLRLGVISRALSLSSYPSEVLGDAERERHDAHAGVLGGQAVMRGHARCDILGESSRYQAAAWVAATTGDAFDLRRPSTVTRTSTRTKSRDEG
jgi:hypothetical protein